MIPRPLILALIFLSALTGWAEEWVSPEAKCAMRIPDETDWFVAPSPQISGGQILLSLQRSGTKDNVILGVLFNMPTDDPEHLAVDDRLTSLVQSQGLKITGNLIIRVNGIALREITGIRVMEDGQSYVSVARAVPRNGLLYFLFANGKGSPERAREPEFLRTIDSFRLISTKTVSGKRDPLANHYQIGFWFFLIAAIGLLISFIVMLSSSRSRPRR
jgi:hypothetical protein